MISHGWYDLWELGSQLRGEAKPVPHETKAAARATSIATILANAGCMPYFRSCSLMDLSMPQRKGIDVSLNCFRCAIPPRPNRRSRSAFVLAASGQVPESFLLSVLVMNKFVFWNVVLPHVIFHVLFLGKFRWFESSNVCRCSLFVFVYMHLSVFFVFDFVYGCRL